MLTDLSCHSARAGEKPFKLADADELWQADSAELAKKYAYAPPVGTGSNATLLSGEYETNARNIARSQAALAATRLANLINDALK